MFLLQRCKCTLEWKKIKTFYRIPLLLNKKITHRTNNGWYVHTTDRTVYNSLQWFKGSLMWKQELQNRWSQWSLGAKKSFFFFFRFVLYSYLVLLTHRTTLPLHVNWFIAAGAGTVDASTHRFIHPLRTATERAGVDEFCLPSFNFGTIWCNTAIIRLLLCKNGAGDKPNEKNGEYRCFLHSPACASRSVINTSQGDS